jgi:L-asparagine oxygenase
MIAREQIFEELEERGYSFIQEWEPELTTGHVAQKIGRIVEIEPLFPSAGILTIQTLQPREQSAELTNQYSGHFGLGEFPLHTDLAHWYRSPRYLLLRCVQGCEEVSTTILSAKELESEVGLSTVARAVCLPRRKSKTQTICPLPVKFVERGITGVRWDPLFLEPLNAPAKDLANWLRLNLFLKQRTEKVQLVHAGDTLVVDNWRALHGRSRVPESALFRKLERVYIDREGR